MTRAFLSREAAPRFAQARIDAISQLGRLAADRDADFIVVAGDVFESNQLQRETVGRARAALRALPVPVFLLPGNHDPLDASSIFADPEFSDPGGPIAVIRDTKPLGVPGIDGVEVCGAPWRSKHPVGDLCGELLDQLDPVADGVRIAVCHGQVDSLAPDTSRPGTIRLGTAEAALADGRIHYLALGDRHSVTDVGDSGRIWYSGAPVATDFEESAPNRALLVELEGERGCRVEELAVGEWHFHARQCALNGSEDVARLAHWLETLPHRERRIVKLGFTGSINLATAAQLERLLSDQAPLFASLKRRSRTTDLVVTPDQLDSDSVALEGYAREAWEELLDAAGDDPEAAAALRLFYRLSRQGQQA